MPKRVVLEPAVLMSCAATPVAKLRRVLARLIPLLRTGKRPPGGYTSLLRHFGALGLFALGIADGSPLPTWGAPDVLTAILAFSHPEAWYWYAAVATAGATTGAYLTFRTARRTGSTYLRSKFAEHGLSKLSCYFAKWGTGALVASIVIPLPFPTSAFFAVAGASQYPTRTFMAIVLFGRALRYSAIAIIASSYGRNFIRVLKHPQQYLIWLVLLAAATTLLVSTAMYIHSKVHDRDSGLR